MAEELDIQSLWNKGKELENPTSLKINMIEKKGTKTTLYWIKIILWIEFSINVICIGPAVVYMNSRDDSPWWIGSAIFVTLVYMVYYQFLIRQINRFSYDGNVVESLKKVYGYLRFYLLHYKVVIWVSMIIGFISGFFVEENQEGLSEIDGVRDWTILIAVSLIMVLILGGIMHFLIHLIYGKKIKRLKNMVKDLESEE